ncbi:MAG: hypothetical protein JJ971_14670 [Balneolaceae bacterium]|nr:hypothetical protein [Balneolaceae bacterium]MBO6547641.1 hypothetical protein [Balneolaceae bacterium]MBO6648152.1 hypothetical protein [Balneolaceae bacterium]
MRLLIADSGATKTSWALINRDEVHRIETSGLNPVYKADKEIESIIFDELLPQLSTKDLSHLFFYGAGCRLWSNAERVDRYLKEAFPKSEVEIKTDIEGAGLSLFGDESGVIVISGTGSSAGFMHKGDLVDLMSSKTYPEGDFGSGCHIGALVLRDYFKDEAPDFIKLVIEKNKKLDDEALFLQFQNPTKSKQIAAKVMRDIGEFIDTEYVKTKAQASIEMLIKQLETHFKEAFGKHPVKLTGSTAFHFEGIFREIFRRKGIEIVEIQKNPIEGLTRYHKKKL